jgi:hypothetical protein
MKTADSGSLTDQGHQGQHGGYGNDTLQGWTVR